MDFKKPHGVITEITTPFSAGTDLQIDYRSVDRLLEAQIAAGIAGIYLHGISSETPFLSEKEQVALVAHVVRRVDRRVSVIANLFCSSKIQALRLLKQFAGEGVDVISVSQPSFYQYNEDALFDYFYSVAENCSLPVWIYNMPQAGYTLTPGFVARLAGTENRICGYKDSTQNIIHQQTVVALVNREDFCLYAGSDATFYSTLTSGGAGIVSLISGLFPKLLLDLYKDYQLGNRDKAFRQQLFIMEVRDALKGAPLITGYKSAAKMLGLFDNDFVYPPLSPMSEKDLSRLSEQLKKLKVL